MTPVWDPRNVARLQATRWFAWCKPFNRRSGTTRRSRWWKVTCFCACGSSRLRTLVAHCHVGMIRWLVLKRQPGSKKTTCFNGTPWKTHSQETHRKRIETTEQIVENPVEMVDFPRFSTFFVGSSVRIEVAPGPRSPSRNGGCSTGPGGRLLGLEMLGHLGTERLLRRETGLLGLWTTWSMDDVYIYICILCIIMLWIILDVYFWGLHFWIFLDTPR